MNRSIAALAFVLLGLANVLYPHRLMFALNGLVMLGIGGVLLFAPRAIGLTTDVPSETLRLISTALGGGLLIWAVQQFSLLGPNHQLFLARTEGRCAEHTPPRSRLIRGASLASLAAALVLGIHVAALYWTAHKAGAHAAANDVILYAAPMLVLLASAPALWFRRRPPYVEAKLTGQFLIVLAVLYAAGLAANIRGGEPALLYALRTGANLAVQLYVWAPIVLLVLAFNRVYSRAARKEVEANLDE